ncbi:unnamed protein product [Anisakis simplex]|uniref:Metastasis suppressor protein 1 n=1 Tax=Anisakis simplex TaxID=6269 RepID=A0A0M3K6W0_ANISI|nr:unnamed protein product [Anisakis simplex]
MLDNDGVKSMDGSSPCSSTRLSTSHSSSEQGPSGSYPASKSNDSTLSLCHLPAYNSEHVRVIPSIHITMPSSFKYLQLQTLTKETITHCH